MSRYVMYQGKRWQVTEEDNRASEGLDYLLRLERSDQRPTWAHAHDCKPIRQAKRRFKDGRHVLEYTSDGQLSIRRARSPKRYSLELADIYNFAVRCAVLKGTRLPKAFRARRRK